MSETTIQPPQPPEFRREFRIYPYQYIMLPLIFVIPLLALLGVFGESGAIIDATSNDISIHVEYTSRIRYMLAAPLIISITNQSNATIDSLTVHLDRAYIKGFSRVSFTPDVTQITDDDYRVELSVIKPDETRIIVIDLQAEKIGLYRGTVSVEGEGIAPMSVALETVLFP